MAGPSHPGRGVIKGQVVLLFTTENACRVAEAQMKRGLNKIEMYFSACENPSQPIPWICDQLPLPRISHHAVTTVSEHWTSHLRWPQGTVTFQDT